LEFTFCEKDPGKICTFAIGPLGAGRRRGQLDSGEPVAGSGRARARGGPRVSYGSMLWAGRGGRATGERRAGGQGGAAAAAAVPGVLGALGSVRPVGELRLGRGKV
jgi:hypothetical protein